MPKHSTNDQAAKMHKETTRGTHVRHSAVKDVGICGVVCVLDCCCLHYAIITTPLHKTAETTTPKGIKSAVNPLPHALYPFI